MAQLDYTKDEVQALYDKGLIHPEVYQGMMANADRQEQENQQTQDMAARLSSPAPQPTPSPEPVPTPTPQPSADPADQVKAELAKTNETIAQASDALATDSPEKAPIPVPTAKAGTLPPATTGNPNLDAYIMDAHNRDAPSTPPDIEKTPAPAPNLPPEIQELADKAAAKYGVDPAIVHRMIDTESAANPVAVSKKGALGLMQLMPGTAQDLGIKNPFDPAENIDGGVKYYSQLLKKFNGDQTLALAAYNAGPGNVDKFGGIPPFAETQAYIKKVLGPQPTANQSTDDQVLGDTKSDAGKSTKQLIDETATYDKAITDKSSNISDAKQSSDDQSNATLQQAIQKSNDQQGRLDQMRKDHDTQQADLKKRLDEIDSISKDAINRQAHPEMYWADKSTGQKILAGIGLFLGSLGGKDGVNQAQKIIEGAITKDVQDRTDTAAKLAAIYTQYKGLADDNDKAKLLLENQGREAVNQTIEAEKAKGYSKEVQGKLELIQQQNQAQQQANALALAKATQDSNLLDKGAQGALTNREKLNLPKEVQEKYVDGFGVARSTDAAKEFEKTSTKADQSISALKDLRQFAGHNISSTFSPTDRTKVDQLVLVLQGVLKEPIFGTGTRTAEYETDMLKRIIANPLGFWTATGINGDPTERLNQVIDILNQAKLGAAKSAGLPVKKDDYQDSNKRFGNFVPNEKQTAPTNQPASAGANSGVAAGIKMGLRNAPVIGPVISSFLPDDQ